MRELELIKVKYICDLKNGFAFKSKDYIENSNTINFRMSQIRPGGRIDLNHNPMYLPDSYANQYKEYLLQEGDVVIAMTDMASDTKILGVPTLIKKFSGNLLLNQRVGKFKDIKKEIIDIPYLRYIITSPQVYSYYKQFGKGGVQINLGKNDILNAEIPLCSLPIQRAIVRKIENLFASLDKGIADLKTAQEQLKVYRQAVLKKAFEGGFTSVKGKDVACNVSTENNNLPEGWKWVKIDTLIESNKLALKAGPFGSALKKEFYVADGYKIYGQEQVISGNPFYGDYYIDEQKYQELISCKVKPGDILISLVGTVGKVLILPDNIKNGIINPRLIKISLDKSKYDNKFFKYYFESSTVKSIYTINASGTTMDVLNIGIIKKIPFPLPPTLAEQHAIVREIESRLSVCDKVEQNIREALEKAEALRQSILKKAFEGKLLTETEIVQCKQEADYEPAAKLLERIKKDNRKKY